MRSLAVAMAVATVILACSTALAAESAGPAAPAALDPLAALNDTARTVSIDVKDAPLENVLRALSKQFGLSIITAKNVDSVVSARFSDVSLREALDSLVTINGFAYRVKDSVIEVYSPQSEEGRRVETPVMHAFELSFANAGRMKDLLKPFLSEAGKIEAEMPGNRLVVYDRPTVIEQLSKIIEKLDQREPQVTITAEILETSVGAGDQFGINWQTVLSASGAKMPTTFPFNSDASGSSFAPGNADNDEFSSANSFPFPTVENFTFGTLDASGLRAVLEVLRTHEGTDLIANPEITTLNNREARISIGDTVPVPIYTTNLETGVSSVTGFDEVDTGTILVVTPQVNPDQSVTMLVRPEISQITGFKGQFDERPIVSSRKAETTVRLRSGETLVIGGLVSETTTNTLNKIPMLGDIPFLGWLFKWHEETTDKRTLYLFITPRIMSDEGYGDRNRKAGNRLVRDGFKYESRDTGGDDLRNPGMSPFEDALRSE